MPSQQPMNPSGMLMIPGFARLYHESSPPSESGPGHTVGLMITSATELITPNSTPVTAPVVLEAAPGQGQQQRREVGAGRDREREAHHE